MAEQVLREWRVPGGSVPLVVGHAGAVDAAVPVVGGLPLPIATSVGGGALPTRLYREVVLHWNYSMKGNTP